MGQPIKIVLQNSFQENTSYQNKEKPSYISKSMDNVRLNIENIGRNFI